MDRYRSSGDLVRIPQHTSLYKPDVPHIMNGTIYFDSTRTTETNQLGVIVERFDTELGVMYQVLVGDQYWCISSDDISWTGV